MDNISTKNLLAQNSYVPLISSKMQKAVLKYSSSNRLTQDVFISFGSSIAPKDISLLPKIFSKKVKVAFTDIDGTIRPFDGTISKETRKTLNECQEQGVILVPSTGRTNTETKDVVSDLGINSGYLITQQGAEILENGKILYQDKLSMSLAKKIVGASLEYKAKFPNANTKMVMYIDGIPYSEEKIKLPINWEEIKYGNSPMDLLNRGKNPTKILFYEPYDDVNKVVDFLKSKLPENLRIGQTAKQYCEITNETATKGNAVNVILKRLRIDHRNAASIGDADNDVPMLEAVRQGKGLSIAMGNAKDSVKNKAEYVTGNVDNNGWPLAFDMILANNKRLS